jgi:hypothetical protein
MFFTHDPNQRRWHSSKSNLNEAYFLHWHDIKSQASLLVKYEICGLKQDPHYGTSRIKAWAQSPLHPKPTVLENAFDLTEHDALHQNSLITVGSQTSLSTSQAHGDIHDTQHNIRWDLLLSDAKAKFHALPWFLRFSRWPKHHFVASRLRATASGSVYINESPFSFEDAPIYQSHEWHHSPVINQTWVRTPFFKEDSQAFLEIRRFPLGAERLSFTSIVLGMEGKLYPLHSLSTGLLGNKVSQTPSTLHVLAHGSGFRFDIQITNQTPQGSPPGENTSFHSQTRVIISQKSGGQWQPYKTLNSLPHSTLWQSHAPA